MTKLLTLLVLLISMTAHGEVAPPAINDLASDLVAWGKDTTLSQAVQTQNNLNLSLADIKARDRDWQKTEGLDSEMEAMMKSPAAKRLKEMEQTAPYFFELFLMDNQGANVAMTNKTSDYWQGDEAKWQKAFKAGTGAVHIGEVEYDESASAYLVQVSLPVMAGGQTIGTITVGINLDEFEAQQ